MRDFQEFVRSIGIVDHAFEGPRYTWSNHQSDTFMARKLDRLDQPVYSPLKLFKFFNFWVKHKDFMNIVAESWGKEVHGDPNPMLRLFIKLKRLKAPLRALNVAAFGQIPERLLHGEFKALQDAEEQFYRQKARVHWIREGDQYTKFFHRTLAVKRSKVTIRALVEALLVLISLQQLSSISQLLPAFNATTITFVPICEHPKHVKEFRPIACYTTVYKKTCYNIFRNHFF
ncbi:hypothetical protein V6Z11_A05G208600 [Gossypium hirsutum]